MIVDIIFNFLLYEVGDTQRLLINGTILKEKRLVHQLIIYEMVQKEELYSVELIGFMVEPHAVRG